MEDNHPLLGLCENFGSQDKTAPHLGERKWVRWLKFIPPFSLIPGTACHVVHPLSLSPSPQMGGHGLSYNHLSIEGYLKLPQSLFSSPSDVIFIFPLKNRSIIEETCDPWISSDLDFLRAWPHSYSNSLRLIGRIRLQSYFLVFFNWGEPLFLDPGHVEHISVGQGRLQVRVRLLWVDGVLIHVQSQYEHKGYIVYTQNFSCSIHELYYIHVYATGDLG